MHASLATIINISLVYNLWHKFSNMAESLTENSIDLLAGMPEENSIPSGEDTTWVNLKRTLGRGNSAGYSDVRKRVQFELDEREHPDSDMSDDDGNGSNTNNNAVNSHKNDANSHENDESAGPLVSHKRPGSTHHGGSALPHGSG